MMGAPLSKEVYGEAAFGATRSNFAVL